MKVENSDPRELAKFGAMAHRWWDPEGDVKTLHQINPLRLRYILEKVDLAKKRVLDIGCGGGLLTEAIAQYQLSRGGADVTGIDLNPDLIEIAKLHRLESGAQCQYQQVAVETLAAQESECFDVITCLEMLEHVPDPKTIVKAAAQLLKPGGHLFFSTLNRHPKSYLFAILGAEYLLKLLPKNTHDYAKFIQPAELAAWSRAAGLTEQELCGISYHPLNKTFSLTQDISVNYLFYATKN